ncbi:winged helix-turn-helix transcriptional regulator [Streptomyces sp. NBC_00433]
MEDAGVIERRRYSDRPPRDEHVLTDAGRGLLAVLGALREWGTRRITPVGTPAARPEEPPGAGTRPGAA